MSQFIIHSSMGGDVLLETKGMLEHAKLTSSRKGRRVDPYYNEKLRRNINRDGAKFVNEKTDKANKYIAQMKTFISDSKKSLDAIENELDKNYGDSTISESRLKNARVSVVVNAIYGDGSTSSDVICEKVIK